MGELVADGGARGQEVTWGRVRRWSGLYGKRDPAGDQEASECCSSVYGLIIE